MLLPRLIAVSIQAACFAQSAVSGGEAYEHVIFEKPVHIGPLSSYEIEFAVPAFVKLSRIVGNLYASGGAGNDIRVEVRGNGKRQFDSGHRRSVFLSIDCPKPGRYSVLFNNRSSAFAGKLVTGRLAVVESRTIPLPLHRPMLVKAGIGRDAAQTIFEHLVTILYSQEGAWGTAQLVRSPELVFTSDNKIGANSSCSMNAVIVHAGLLRFAAQSGALGEDILAGTLAHELGHLLHRHPGYGSHQGRLAAIWDELRGITRLDRAQEREADMQGVQLACAAGFDPHGMLALLAKYQRSGAKASSSFMQTHPAAQERSRYVEREAARCGHRLALQFKDSPRGVAVQ